MRQLLFLTDVDGVLDASGSVRPVLSAPECERLIADGVAKGGMRAKLDAGELEDLTVEGNVPSLSGAVEWLNSPPLRLTYRSPSGVSSAFQRSSPV